MVIDNEFKPVIGIDLGTTFSAIARWDGRGPRIYQTKMGDDTLQSVVYIDPDSGEMLVGKLAYNRGLLFPERMVIGVKRTMDNAKEKITVSGREYTPIELSSEILKKIYKDVEEKYPPGKFKSRGVVVTVPYYFKAHQCENTRKAAEQAALECLGIIQEPIAASLSYAWQLVQDHPDEEGQETILVFDLGGGTFDLTLFNLIKAQDKLTFEVLATGGDDRLGGLDFDECLAQLILKNSGISLEGLPAVEERKAKQKILGQAVDAKITLSSTIETFIAISDVIPGSHIDMEITRGEFEDCIAHYVERIEDIVKDTFSKTNLKASQIDRVILVGGSSNIPRMKQLLMDIVGEDKIYANTSLSLCVAEGAAIYAAYLDDREIFGREIEIKTRTCHALGVEISGGEFHVLVPANRKTPCEFKQVFTTDEDDLDSLDVKIYQGSAKLVKSNSLIGAVNISGLPKKKKGELDVNVMFKVNEEQALSVTVEAEGLRKSASLRYT